MSTATATRPAKRTTKSSSTRSKTSAATPRKQTAATRRGASKPREVGDAIRNRPVPRAIMAADRAVEAGRVHIHLPVIGDVGLPSADEAAFVGGVTALAALGLIEWPVAIVLGVGHHLALNNHVKAIRAFGQALEEV